MISTMERDYESVAGLVHQTVFKFWSRHRGDLQEMRQEAGLHFIEARRTHNPSKGKFTTWVARKVWYGLSESRRVAAIKAAQREKIRARLLGERRSSFTLREFLEGLSPDAKLAVALCVDPPLFVSASVGRRRSPARLRNAVRGALFEMGWGAERVEKTFSEITEAL